MRVTTELWVSAIVRRAFSEGGFAAIIRRGSGEAGAVFLLTRDRFGENRLYAPAPQSSYDNTQPEERVFVEALRSSDDGEISKRIERETRFDTDVWVVELEVSEANFARLVSVMTP